MDLVADADTNIWLRLADTQAAQHQQARDSVIRLLERNARIYLLPQNLIEFWAVATRPHAANGLGWTIERCASELANLQSKFELLHENEQIFEKWSEAVLSQRISGKRVHDARLAVQLLVHGISRLLTFNDADFAVFPWIVVLRPREI